MNRPLPALLTCQSSFSEGRSTVGPRRLVRLAKEGGYGAVGLTDWCSVAGAVELCEAAGEAQISAVIGVTLPVLFPAPPKSREAHEPFLLVLLAKDRRGYALLCELITQVHMQHPDGLPLERLQEAASRGDHLACLTGGRQGFPTVLGERKEMARAAAYLRTLRQSFPFDLYIQLFHGAAPNERRRLEYLRGLARDLELPVVAAPEINMGAQDEYPCWTP